MTDIDHGDLSNPSLFFFRRWPRSGPCSAQRFWRWLAPIARQAAEHRGDVARGPPGLGATRTIGCRSQELPPSACAATPREDKSVRVVQSRRPQTPKTGIGGDAWAQ